MNSEAVFGQMLGASETDHSVCIIVPRLARKLTNHSALFARTYDDSKDRRRSLRRLHFISGLDGMDYLKEIYWIIVGKRLYLNKHVFEDYLFVQIVVDLFSRLLINDDFPIVVLLLSCPVDFEGQGRPMCCAR